MINVKSIIVTLFFMIGVTFSQNSLTLENLDTEAGTVDVFMDNDVPVAGFQFNLDGVCSIFKDLKGKCKRNKGK